MKESVGTESSPELTVVIPTYNNPEGARDLVNDFYRLHDVSMFRIISIDQTEEGIPFDHEPHLHIRTYRNLGFSKAQNTGWKLSQTRYTLLANDDVRLLSKDWYEDAKKVLNGYDDVIAVNPMSAVRTWDGGGEPRWFWDIHGDKFDFVKGKPFDEYTHEDYEMLKRLNGNTNSPGTTMFFTLLYTDAREKIGLLDEAYWNNGEDYDWNRRAFIRGWKILSTSKSVIHHQCGVTKQKAAAKQSGNYGYDLVANAKNIFNKKWGDQTTPNPDIYGKTGLHVPTTPWYTEVDL